MHWQFQNIHFKAIFCCWFLWESCLFSSFPFSLKKGPLSTLRFHCHASVFKQDYSFWCGHTAWGGMTWPSHLATDVCSQEKKSSMKKWWGREKKKKIYRKVEVFQARYLYDPSSPVVISEEVNGSLLLFNPGMSNLFHPTETLTQPEL